MQSLFLVSRGIIRPSLRARAHLASMLSSYGTIALSARSAVRSTLSSLDPTETPAALLFYNRRAPANDGASKQEPDNEELLDAYLLAGGGLLVIGNADLPQGTNLERLPAAPILVHQVNEFSRVFDGIGDFELRDTVILRPVTDGMDIQFTASDSGATTQVGDSDTPGSMVPVIWTRYRGKGRLCYVGLELRAASLRHPAVREIVRQAVEWLLSSRRDASSV